MDRDYFAYAQSGAVVSADQGYTFDVRDNVPFVVLDEPDDTPYKKARLEEHKKRASIPLSRALIWLGAVVLVLLVIGTCKLAEIKHITASIDACYERCANLLEENRVEQYASQIEQARSRNRISTAATQQLGMVPSESIPVYQVYAPSTRPNEDFYRMQNGGNLAGMNYQK